ncbi:MAG: flagellar filament capping protein FliD [Lachnospiraceae bacterium]|nr:flagellar filament capping protein FliD [Lachnospiraceae bacterium]
MASPIRMSGMVSGLDTESIVKALTSSYQTKVDKYTKAQTKLSWKQDAWKEVNTKINDFYNSLDNYRYQSSWNLQKATASDATKATVTANGAAFNGTQSLSITRLASAASLTGGKLGEVGKDDNKSKVTSSTKLSDITSDAVGKTITIKAGSTEKNLKIDADTTVQSLVNTLKDAGLNASFDEDQQRFYISSKKSGSAQSFSLSEDGTSSTVLDALKLTNGNYSSQNNGIDAEITLNGVNYSSSSNNFSINGLNIQALATTSSDITVTTQTDTQGIYDKVKEFISSYNDLINDLTDRYNAASSGSYEPLTDDEKAQMSDTEVEKWEKKIKTGLLRRDDTLDSLMSTLTNGMMNTYYDDSDATFDEDGNQKLKDGVTSAQRYSLASFGIMTKGILQSATNRQYEYHIDGDEDDASVSSKTDKLMTAITEDPDKVVDFMKNLTNNLSKELKKKMTATSLRTVFTVYNDKEMASEYSSYTKLINQWTTRLNDMQDSYYKQFSKMESALQELQSSTSSISGLVSS